MDTASTLGNGTEGRVRWSLRLLGGFELSVLVSGERVALPGKRERVLLAYLALSPKASQPRRKLAALLWGDATDETLLDNLRNGLFNLRKALGDSEHRVVTSQGEDIVFDAASFEVDALAFRRLAAQSGRSELEEAAKLYSGEFLDGLAIDSEEFESWRRAEAARYQDQAVDVLTRLMAQFAECGETERAIATGERILTLEPLHEGAVRRLMRHYGESGRRSAAIHLYRTLADTLRTELDAQPEAETRAVFAEIARGGEERTSDPAPTDAKLPLGMARPIEVYGGPTRPAFGLRTPLAILAGVVIVAAAFISYWQFALQGAPAGITAERATAADPASAIAIAVLPFLNLSGDANQEFFSDGMTEEITSALAMVPDLKVVARTSAFRFKGEKNDMRAVGQALNATHLIEGSVRKVGDRVRITAQLIEVGTGTHLWTQNYDRQLSDIFATQEEIARTIVGSLMTPLGLAPGERLVSNRNIDPESYQQFLLARAILRDRAGPAQFTENRYGGAIAMLEQVVARDPSYAPAWALLALMSSDAAKRETAAREAIRLDSRNAVAYVALAQVENFRGNTTAGEDLYRQALALDPYDPEVLAAFSLRLVFVGRIKEALNMRERLRTLEPFVPVYNTQTANLMLIDGQNQAAIAILQALPAEGPRNISLSQAYAAEGRYQEAADTLLAIPLADRAASRQSIEDAARLLRSAPTMVTAPEALPEFRGLLNYVYAYVGALDRGLEDPERAIAGEFSGLPQFRHLWSPEYAPIRKTERFKALMRELGFVDYWRARGWADVCRPLGADDFACD